MILSLLWKWAVLSGVFIGAAALIPQVKVKAWHSAIGAALVFGVANALIGWLLKGITTVVLFLPNFITFGLLVPLLVNMALLKLTDVVVEEDLEIEGWRGLLGTAAAVSVASAILY